MPVIQGILVREIRCKNDDCRKLICYEKIRTGVLIYECSRCGQVSIFKINYSKGQEDIDKLTDVRSTEGGELLNGGFNKG